MTSTLKQELLNKISSSNDEVLFNLLNTEYNFFTHEENLDVTDGLSTEDLTELTNLIKEPFGNDTVSLEEYTKATERWRTN
jgi:hypothetical protein